MFFINKSINVAKSYYKYFSTNLQRSTSNAADNSSLAIRQKFLDFFINENKHSFVRSSPVVPYCDPTVPFVNAGMNQFKGIFLGTQTPQHARVANSQKCVRVGGKHNDLSVVGSDGYHHTFFEMLGNWSFGDYFKKEACAMSWKLLTDVYGIDSSSLYVTYFKGDPELGLEADYECKEIWREIGVPDSRIIPFGADENFWEMGLTGPCGPCTEIHIDRIGTQNRAIDVNRGLENLTELWNIVFIQYNRLENNSIEPLPQYHIDTGMGFERLTAVLQDKISNYDTDIFKHLFNGIHKLCKHIPTYEGKFGKHDENNLDTNYRILADHSRMITASLADGMIPEENQKLRRIMRKVFTINNAVFKSENLLKEMSFYVADSFKDCYPEMCKNLLQVQQIILYEQELFNSLRSKATEEWTKLVKVMPKLDQLDVLEMPGLIGAFKELQSKNNEISGQTAYKLYDTYGLDEYTIKQLASALNMKFDPNGFKSELHIARMKSKSTLLTIEDLNSVKRYIHSKNIEKTDDRFRYDYTYINNNYVFKDLSVKLLLITFNNEMVSKIKPNVTCKILLDKTNMYYESGGQSSDKGYIKFLNGIFEINNIINVDRYILHEGKFISSDKESCLCINESGTMSVDPAIRSSNMKNHTATHLLNAAIKKITSSATCQKSSQVTPDFLSFDVSIFGEKLKINDLEAVENEVKICINNAVPVTFAEVDSQSMLLFDDITLLPGEIYPDNGIRIIEILSENLFSREACCGTHVINTNHLEDFCIISTHSVGRSTISVDAVTGKRAVIAKQFGKEMLDNVNILKKNIDDNIDKPEMLENTVANLKKQLNYKIDDANIMPIYIKHECLDTLNLINKKIRESARQTLKGFIEIEMKNALKTNTKTTKSKQPYVVHYLRSSTILESVSLQKVTNLCTDLPILVISYVDGIVKARCCVPEKFVTPTFNAEIWVVSTVAKQFKSSAVAPKGQVEKFVCNMRGKKVNIIDWEIKLKAALKLAENFVENNL